MVKTALVYYSWNGSNRLFAENLAAEYNLDLIPISELRKRGFLKIAFERITGRLPAIRPLSEDLGVYERILFCGPVWMGKPATPLVALMKKHATTAKQWGYLTVCGGGETDQNLEETITQMTGRKPSICQEFPLSRLVTREEGRNLSKILKKRLTKPDISTFVTEMQELTQFLRSHN